jgi:hypothetical protein
MSMDFDLPKAVAVLERTPRALRALLSGLPAEWVHANEGPDTFSPFDVVGHLINGEETNWIPRAKVILAQGDERRFPPFDRFRSLDANRNRSLDELLAEFERARDRSLQELASFELTPAHLNLTGEHPEFGSVTLAQLLSTWVVHDLSHTAQVVRVMAGQYREAVGPWRAYLRVLR